MKECINETCPASENMKCKDDVQYGDKRGKHVDVVKQDKHIDLDVDPRDEDHEVADEFNFPEDLHVEETGDEQRENEKSFYDLDGVVVDEVAYGDKDEANLAENQDVVHQSDAGLPENIRLCSQVITNEVVPWSFHPGRRWKERAAKVLVFTTVETTGK